MVSPHVIGDFARSPYLTLHKGKATTISKARVFISDPEMNKFVASDPDSFRIRYCTLPFLNMYVDPADGVVFFVPAYSPKEKVFGDVWSVTEETLEQLRYFHRAFKEVHLTPYNQIKKTITWVLEKSYFDSFSEDFIQILNGIVNPVILEGLEIETGDN